MRTIQRTFALPAITMLLLASLTARTGVAQTPAYAILYSFEGPPGDGATPLGGVILGKDGVLYGATNAGGTGVSGTIFQLAPPTTETSWAETLLHNFTGPDGASPNASLAFGSAGTLYGATPAGGSAGQGTVFDLTPPSEAGGAWTETVLYSFSGYYGQNENPNGQVFVSRDGVLYTTAQGSPAEGVGAYLGAVGALAPPAKPGAAWKEYVINYFGDGGVLGGSSGAQPLSGVVSEDGALFGTTWSAGDVYCSVFGCGVVYKLTPPTGHGAWTETVIYTFTGPRDGAFPQAALTVGPGGVLYGTTTYGGSGACVGDGGVFQGCGTVFQLTPSAAPGGSWTESVIHTFTGLDGDGANPAASVTVAKDGVIYGTTENGGSLTAPCPSSYIAAAGCGTVFEVLPPAAPGDAWTEKVLHAFTNQNGDGAYPTAALSLDPAGVLFGTTSAGGAAGLGAVFAIKP